MLFIFMGTYGKFLTTFWTGIDLHPFDDKYDIQIKNKWLQLINLDTWTSDLINT